jgi:ACS family hexuronate transporter-like MFS transporter
VTLAACRFLLGLAESFVSPAGVKAVSEWISTRERGLSMAVFTNGGVFGAIIAPPLVAFLALRFGWRWGFVGTGVLGLVLAAIWWRNYYPPDQHPRLSAKERAYIADKNQSSKPAVPVRLSMWQLMQHPLCVGFFVMRFLTDSTTYFFNFWLPDYLQHARGFTLAMIGLVGWLPFLASDIGGPGGGALSDALVRRGWAPQRARRALMLMAACLMPLAMVAVRTGSAWVAVALIAVLLAAQSCWMANQLTLIAESVASENVATMLALSAMGGSIGGIISTLIAGRVIESMGYVPVFTAIGLLHLLAFAILTVAMRERRQTPGRTPP